MARPAADAGSWRTAIAVAGPDDVRIRGYSLRELMVGSDYVSGVYLLFVGELPSRGQRDMLDTMLLSAIDHGISPSATVSRFVAGSGSPVQASVAAGLLTFGDIHAGAGEEFARIVAAAVEESRTDGDPLEAIARRIVGEHREARQRLPGFGHPQHPSGDPRAPILIERGQQLGVAGDHVAFTLDLEAAIENASGKRIPLNIDGALGSLMLDLGFSWRHARPLAMISRIAGLSAHAIEEYERGRGWLALPDEVLAYDGRAPRPLPREKPSGSR